MSAPGAGEFLLDLPREETIRILAASPLVRRWVWHAQIDSTQCLARELAVSEGPGLLVLADTQTAGRGRMGRSWFSPRHAGLWLSMVVGLQRPAQEWPLVTSLAALALREAVEVGAGLLCALKWPNDLIHRGRKLAGILADVGPGDAVVLGVGLNVGQRVTDFPPELRDRAGSILTETGQLRPRGCFLEAFLEALARWLERFEEGAGEEIRAALREASLLMGRTVCVRQLGGVSGRQESSVRGRVCDIGVLGELILEPLDASRAVSEWENSAGETEGAGTGAGRVTVSSGVLLEIDPPIEGGK
ncbi:MAG: biotin--[acetyl-CoA-carboxylase] ligase [Candidatus Eisenbacteria sp.]|nr:biotin--[acetyl-CoA-carboxylase] ligase [Candidatus Eisenbacteria bacterium]